MVFWRRVDAETSDCPMNTSDRVTEFLDVCHREAPRVVQNQIVDRDRISYHGDIQGALIFKASSVQGQELRVTETEETVRLGAMGRHAWRMVWAQHAQGEVFKTSVWPASGAFFSIPRKNPRFQGDDAKLMQISTRGVDLESVCFDERPEKMAHQMLPNP